MEILLLGDDETTDILCRLPIKDILRARSVCKSWRSIIDSNTFKGYHYAVQCSTSANITDGDVNITGPPLLFNLGRLFYDDYQSDDYYSFYHESNFYLLSTVLEKFHDLAPNLNRDIRKNNTRLYMETLCVKGVARGVVCLLNPDIESYTTYSRKNVTLWNPSLRELKNIPLPLPTCLFSLSSDSDLVPPQEYTVRVLGFGFDHVSNQFKMLSSTSSYHWCRYSDDMPSEDVVTAGGTSYDLYSQKTDSWKTLHYVDHDASDPSLSSFTLADGTAIRPIRLDRGFIANHTDHVVYCMAKLYHPENKNIKSDNYGSHTTLRLPPKIILAFDFVSEKFHKVSDLPAGTCKRSCRGIMPYKDSLAVIIDDRERDSCELWVMNKLLRVKVDEHISVVWKKVLVLGPTFPCFYRPEYRRHCKPLLVLKNGRWWC